MIDRTKAQAAIRKAVSAWPPEDSPPRSDQSAFITHRALMAEAKSDLVRAYLGMYNEVERLLARITWRSGTPKQHGIYLIRLAWKSPSGPCTLIRSASWLGEWFLTPPIETYESIHWMPLPDGPEAQ